MKIAAVCGAVVVVMALSAGFSESEHTAAAVVTALPPVAASTDTVAPSTQEPAPTPSVPPKSASAADVSVPLPTPVLAPTPTLAPAPTSAHAPAPTSAPVTKKAPAPVSKCHPEYSGCLQIDAGDYDCAGGSGNGPNYTGKVQVYGSDPFGLDRDGNGWGCE